MKGDRRALYTEPTMVESRQNRNDTLAVDAIPEMSDEEEAELRKKHTQDLHFGNSLRVVFKDATVGSVSQLYCALISSVIYGFALGFSSFSYWIYNDMRTIGTWDFAYCVMLLCFLDMSTSTLLPWLISVIGLEDSALITDIYRMLATAAQFYYFSPISPANTGGFHHDIFTLCLGLNVICNPMFTIGAAQVDKMVSATYPELRLFGNFFPVLCGAFGFAGSTGLLYVIGFETERQMMWCVAAIVMVQGSLIVIEWFAAMKVAADHEGGIESFGSMALYMDTLKTFLNFRCIMTAWTTDGILASTWIIFSWFVPVFSTYEKADGTYPSIADVVAANYTMGVWCASAGSLATVVWLVWRTWGILENHKLRHALLFHHMYLSWSGLLIYAIGLLIPHPTAQLLFCTFSLGISFATPNSLIILLSVDAHNAVAFSGFAQISFVICAYVGSLWMNFYGESWYGFSQSFFVCFTISCLIFLIPFTYYETFIEPKNYAIICKEKEEEAEAEAFRNNLKG